MDPPESTTPPDCPDDLLGFLPIFWELGTCRAAGFSGPGPIPWTAIDTYAQRMGIADDEVLYGDLVFYMRKMDEVYLSYAAEQSAVSSKSSGKSKSGRPGKSEW